MQATISLISGVCCHAAPVWSTLQSAASPKATNTSPWKQQSSLDAYGYDGDGDSYGGSDTEAPAPVAADVATHGITPATPTPGLTYLISPG